MTTHDFPQRSRHGFFRQSPHDFLDRTPPPGKPHMIVIFIDEVGEAYNIVESFPPFDPVLPPRPDLLANWEADLAQLFPTQPGSVSLAEAPARILLFHLRANVDDPVWVALTPTGSFGDVAPYMLDVHIGRGDDAPSIADIRGNVRSFLSQFPEVFGDPPNVERVSFWIDNSGSMGVDDVAGIPGVIGGLILDEVNPDVVLGGEFPDNDERWLQWIERALREAELP